MGKLTVSLFILGIWLSQLSVASASDKVSHFQSPQRANPASLSTEPAKSVGTSTEDIGSPLKAIGTGIDEGVKKGVAPKVVMTMKGHSRANCGWNLWTWMNDPWGCFIDIFFTGGSFSDWIWGAVNGNEQANELISRIVRRCGRLALEDMGVPSAVANLLTFFEEVGPYDAILCDLVNVARTGDITEFDLIHVTQCAGEGEDTVATDCRNQFLATGSKSEMLTSLISAITGWGWNESASGNADFISTAAAWHQSCASAGGDATGCLSRAFVSASCQGLCRSASCQLSTYATNENQRCQEALSTGCPAMSAAVQETCSALHGGANNAEDFLADLGDPTQGRCDFCDGGTISSVGVLTLVSLLLWSIRM